MKDKNHSNVQVEPLVYQKGLIDPRLKVTSIPNWINIMGWRCTCKPAFLKEWSADENTKATTCMFFFFFWTGAQEDPKTQCYETLANEAVKPAKLK